MDRFPIFHESRSGDGLAIVGVIPSVYKKLLCSEKPPEIVGIDLPDAVGHDKINVIRFRFLRKIFMLVVRYIVL